MTHDGFMSIRRLGTAGITPFHKSLMLFNIYYIIAWNSENAIFFDDFSFDCDCKKNTTVIQLRGCLGNQVEILSEPVAVMCQFFHSTPKAAFGV